jgi:hypothetical protein
MQGRALLGSIYAGTSIGWREASWLGSKDLMVSNHREGARVG